MYTSDNSVHGLCNSAGNGKQLSFPIEFIIASSAPKGVVKQT